MENERRAKLESRIAKASGILAGAGLTALGCYNPELTPYIAIGGVVGGVVGAGSGGDVGGVVGVGRVIGLVGGVVGVVGGVGGVVGGKELLKEPVKFAKRMFAYGMLSSALTLGGNYLGRSAVNVKSVSIPAGTNETGRIILHSSKSERHLYEYETNNVGKVFLPKEEILRLESEKLRNNSNSNLEVIFEKYK